MTGRFYRSIALLACSGLVSLSACTTDQQSGEPEDAVAPSLDAPGLEQSAASRVMAIAEFEASWDPASQDLSFRMLGEADWSTPVDDRLRVTADGLFCETRNTSGRRETYTLITDTSSLFFQPTDCGLPNTFPYDTQGTFCADIAVRSNFPGMTQNVYAEITSVVPDVGHNGYVHPFGTGADPSMIPPAVNEPIAAAGGLWSYGDIPGGGSVSTQWVFEYTPEAFTFRGRLVRAVTELDNGADDDCDGVIDNRLFEFPDGSACTHPSDCISGNCDAGLCAPATPCGNSVCDGSETAATCPVDCPDTCGDSLCTGAENSATCAIDCPETCGDALCTGSESTMTCPPDCGTACGDTVCNGAENASTCAADCPDSCGDSLCTGAENASTCNADCPDSCGDTFCTGTETNATCAVDCPASCGDTVCNGTETAASCPADCPDSCGDSFCTGTETPITCLADCPTTCGDSFCAGTETPVSCLADCPTTCGDSFCAGTENASSCAADCPDTCGDSLCTGTETNATCAVDCPASCGDTVCNGTENAASCPADCPDSCGDSFCTGTETPITCLADCPTTCGDSFCAGTETPVSCLADCPTTCGDSFCAGTENASSCAADCPDTCGDSFCTGAENASTCATDCPDSCGDSFCTGTETPITCLADCPTTCGDSFCAGTENASSCAADCPDTCGDSFCTGAENASTCATDCPDSCGDSFCTGTETPITCLADCPTTCGDSFCAGTENASSCAADCPDTCGDSFCTGAENASTCATDCPDSCGDSFCTGTETPITCLADCPTTCGDSFCAGTENASTCATDCPDSCGDSFCTGAENASTCATDCPDSCGDSFCTGTETPITCLADCPTTCGDSFCAGTENASTCATDCPDTCGDSFCTGAENASTCATDCPDSCGDGFCTGTETPITCLADCPTTCGDSFCAGTETSATCSADCGAAGCGDNTVDSTSTPTTVTISYTGANCSGSAGEVNLTLNGTSYGPFTTTNGCFAGAAPERVRITDASVYQDLVNGPNSFTITSTNFGVYWAKIRIDNTGDEFVFTEQNPGDAIAENLLGVGSLPPLANATITPTPSGFYPVEECDDGNTTGGDGCTADCTSEVGGFCGDGDVNSPGTNDVTAITWTWAGIDCSGAEDYEAILSLNGADIATVDGTNGCLCGSIFQSYTVTDQAIIDTLRGTNDVFGFRVQNGGGNTVWSRVEVFSASNPVGDMFVFNERTVGDAAAMTAIPCGPVDYPALDYGQVIGSPDTIGAYPCDDGDLVDGDGCDSNCTITGCGNGIVTSGEFCDESGDNTLFCDSDCTAPSCGDGLLNPAAGEQCDDNNNVDGDGCNATCGIESCGDGVTQAGLGEQCDDNNNNNGDGCDFVCQTEVCGDGIQQSAEACDDGNTSPGDGCSPTCQVECGDGNLDGPTGAVTSVAVEFLGTTPCNAENQLSLQIGDLVVPISTRVLPASCACTASDTSTVIPVTDPRVIGALQGGRREIALVADSYFLSWAESIVNGTERYTLFDPYNDLSSTNSCNSEWEGFDRTLLYYREACDGGAGCTSECTIESCGNGIIEETEECDDGNTTEFDGCNNLCMLESCGDGTLDSGEGCDDGGSVDGDGCSSICRVEECGNGITDGTEQCDDGNLVAGDGCDETCMTESCGNGIVDVGEGCDGGASCDGLCQITGCVLGNDGDNDRIDDCYETNTGIYVSLTNTGTSPLDSDSDDDGIEDGDEVYGTMAGLNLPALGVNPNRKDVLVEVDWTQVDPAICTGVDDSHRIADWEADLLRQMFAQAPHSNPDGSRGINLILDYGQSPQFQGGNEIATTDDYLDGGVGGVDFTAHKAANFAPERNGYFHYNLSARAFNATGNSGQAEKPGDDLIVTTGCGPSLFRAGTYAHELGHNLGLGHGGFENCNYKPNYASIMNYRGTGLDVNCDGLTDGFFNFSSGTMLSVDENAVDETSGLCGADFDFNADSTINMSTYALDLNSSETAQAANCGGTLTVLQDHDDWGNLIHTGISDGDGFNGRHAEVIRCDPPHGHEHTMTLPAP